MSFYNSYLNQKGGVRRFVENVLHTEVINKYANVHQSVIDNATAKKLEMYFNRILKYVDFGQDSYGLKDSFVEELIMAGLPINQLFNYKGMTASMAGIEFEKDLERIASTAFQNIENDLGRQLVVGKSTYTGEQLKNIPVRYLDAFNKETDQWIRGKFDKQTEKESEGLYRLGGVQGKIDVRIPNSAVRIDFNFSPEVLDFINLLRGLNITAKNYTNVSKISFGSASYFRVVTSVMEDLNYPEDVALKVYYATRSRNTTIAEHKYHLRYAYEVLGPGQYYDINGQLQSLGMTNFLFVFDKTARYIYVRSTVDIVRKAIEKGGAAKAAAINLTE